MIKIAPIIRQMILEGQSVGVPGLGTFHVRHIPSSYDEKNKLLNPPSREIIFEENRYLQNANFISILANKENISVDEAFQRLAEYLSGSYAQISEGKRVKFSGLGLLHKDENGKLQFEPEEELLSGGEFFGLKPVPLASKRKKKKNKHLVFRIFLGILLLAGLAITSYWGVMVYEMMKKPKETKTEAKPENVVAKILLNDTGSVSHDSLPAFPPKAKTIQETLTNLKQEPLPAQPITKASAATEKVKVKEAAKDDYKDVDISGATQKYYIIAGCFRSEEGAKRYVRELSADGWEAAIIGKTASGLNMVAYVSFVNKSLAEQELKRIREEENKDAYMVLR